MEAATALRGPVTACVLLCLLIVGLQASLTLGPWARDVALLRGGLRQAAPGVDSAVLEVLARAQQADPASSSRSSTSSTTSSSSSINSGACQPSRQALLAVAAAAQAFRHVADVGPHTPGTATSAKQAHQLAAKMRAHLAKRWIAALRPLCPTATSKLKSARSADGSGAGASGGCRSVRIPPLRSLASGDSTAAAAAANSTASAGGGGGSSRGGLPSTTLLLVLNSWERLEQQLQDLALSLLMMWGYASMHGYDLHIYVHGAELPPWMPVYFIKPPGISHMLADWGYEHVLYLDWDVLISPHSAPPLSLFFGEYPAASMLQQGEYNLCAGVSLWRNTPQAAALLRAWWELGYAGCCPTTQHDQSALKHLVAAYLANFTGQPALYGPKQQEHFALPAVHPAQAAAAAAAAGEAPASAQDWQQTVYSTESPPQSVSTYLRIRPQLQQQGSAIGLVGLDAHYPEGPAAPTSRRVVLTSCMGIWWGCVPADTPALLYHVGHVYAVEWPSWLVPRLLGFLRDWISVVSDMAAGVSLEH